MKKGRFISLILCFALGFGLGRSSFLDNLSFPSFSWPEFHFSFDFLHGLPFFSPSDGSSSVQSSMDSIQINTIQVKESNNQEILFPYRSSPYDLSEYDPAVYEGIVHNEAFKQAFTFIYQNYGAVAQELLTYTDTIVSSSKEDYDRLMKEINTSSSLQTCIQELTS